MIKNIPTEYVLNRIDEILINLGIEKEKLKLAKTLSGGN